MLSISQVERDTGLSKDTLRMWERRYGFPQPSRDEFGERLYDASCLLLSDRERGLTGSYREPSSELGVGPFVASLLGRAIAFAKTGA